MFKDYRESGSEHIYHNYYDTLILDSGQTIKIEFNEGWSNDRYYYGIYLVIMNKKKSEDNTYLKNTGKDGLRGLVWAKRKIQEFEIFIKEENKLPITIYCTWSDNRRRNTYAYGLNKLGYRFDMVFNKKALCKKI